MHIWMLDPKKVIYIKVFSAFSIQDQKSLKIEHNAFYCFLRYDRKQ